MHATFWSMKNDSLEGCVREKREGEGENAKDPIVRRRKREKAKDLERNGPKERRERRRDREEEYLRKKRGRGGSCEQTGERASE